MLINKVYMGDSEEVMRTFPNNIIPTIITDPPYGLNFNNQKWDYAIPQVSAFQAMLRITKPGGYLVCFGGSRTFHRMAVNIEDAGWFIKDVVMWLYLNGFPKGLNISKAIDKAADMERRIIVEKRVQRNTTTWNRKGMLAKGIQNMDITEPASNLAKEWDDYNTTLKPFYEPIIIAQKAPEGTYIENAMRYGVGGYNIKDTEIIGDDKEVRWPGNIIIGEGVDLHMEQNSVFNKGLASRYFYTPKPSRAEKNLGVEDNPHYTVKPVDLMRYLCLLTRPPGGGVVLDPYCGSGTTLMGAVLASRDWVGIDNDENYVELANKRARAVEADNWLASPAPGKKQINMFE